MNTQVIITKEPGQVIPRGYLQEALKKCPTCFGITIQDNVDGEPVLDTSAEKRTMDVDELFKIVEQCKDLKMVIVLGSMTQDFDAETDMQPYVFQQKSEGEDPQDILSVCFEGDFPSYSKPGAGHTDEYNLWENLIYPSLYEKFEASQDLPDFFRRIASSAFEQLLMNAVGHRAVAVFTPLEGDIVAFGRNELGDKFEWGTTSNTFGWGKQFSPEKAVETAVTAVKKAGGRLSRLMGSTSTATPPATPAPTPDKEKPTIKTDENGTHHITPAKPDTTHKTDVWSKWPGTSAATHTMMSPPSGLQGNARNRWIRLFTDNEKGELPKNKDHKDFVCPVPLSLTAFAQEQMTTNDQVKILVDRVKKFSGSKGGNVSDAAMAEAHTTASNKKPAAQPEGDTRPTSDFLPESPADEAKASAELVTEWATNPSAPTALEVQRIEAKWPLFTKSRGITLSNVARWSIADKKLFTKRCPNEAARLISELVLKLHEYGAFEPDVEVPEHKTDKQVQVPSQQPTPAPTQPAAAGKKTSRLSRLTGQGQAA